MDSKGTPYYLQVIWDKDLHPFPQPPIPEENKTTSESKPDIYCAHVSDQSPTSEGNLTKTSESKPYAVDANVKDLSTIDGKITICRDKVASQEDECECESVYDAISESLHPYPLPSVPNKEVQSRSSTYNELWSFPEPEWPECRREFRFSFNCNPLKLRRKTICCLFVLAVFAAVLIGLTITISILMGRLNTGKFWSIGLDYL